MKILALYNNDIALELFDWLTKEGHEVVLQTQPLDASWCAQEQFDLTVSYTYRYILPKDVLKALGDNVVNLHNSLLPWNRGADPNIWSIVEGTPRGVTLHYMDENLDKGYIISQEIVDDNENETLASSYENLDRAAKTLFKKSFKYYKYWPSLKKRCVGEGSYHSVKDGIPLKSDIDSYGISVSGYRIKLAESKCLAERLMDYDHV